ncbi:LytTR family transcriptional regulator [Lacihabitans sp. LS3-19]|uniref:LytR/AlgR family response regulator transcription factor n=1 Tax=Lacihabitans sp. LS3-19 TaxID=2487335 RepID=UPI0020CCCFF1|nr:LytTR family DNA-binding domain-containing protein [Lacihabitans sp. LS3-19]MCP9770288.1 LytTR family transcriptional regulator [Lacihabitans sp. LS3-19]
MKAQRKKITENNGLLRSPYLAIHVGSRTYLQAAEIVMISADISYSYIHLNDGKKIIVSTNIQKLQERLLGVKNIVRVHRSFMINVNYLKTYDEKKAALRFNLSCPISRRKKNDLKIALNY